METNPEKPPKPNRLTPTCASHNCPNPPQPHPKPNDPPGLCTHHHTIYTNQRTANYTKQGRRHT